MLVLSRNVGESITIILPNGERIEVLVAKYKGQQTSIGIEASRDVKILRNELLCDSDFQLRAPRVNRISR